MEFNSDGICILSSIQHPDECDAYIEFLLMEEKPRHQAEKYLAELRITGAVHHWQRDDKPEFWKAMMRFRDSAATRHQQDIDAIDRLLPKIQAHKETLK